MAPTMGYEHARNLAVLFFYERLVDRGAGRTLHDLSCQFGAKGFTREMRQIVGGSQTGLRKFLAQFPVLFSLDGDTVDLVTDDNTTNYHHTSSSSDDDGTTAEAVTYFVGKLQMYGRGEAETGLLVEVPVRSLLGHRSQATARVRHQTGQQIDEFRQFLRQHSNVFHLNAINDTVSLVTDDDSQMSLPSVSCQLSTELFDFLAQCIEVKGPILIEQLFQLVSCNLDETLWRHLFHTPTEMLHFLRLFGDSVQIRSNLVTLVQPQLRPNSSRLTVTNITKMENKTPSLQLSNDVSRQTLKERVCALVTDTVQKNSRAEQLSSSPIIISNTHDCQQVTDDILKSVPGPDEMEGEETEWSLELDPALRRGPIVAVAVQGVNLNAPDESAHAQITQLQLATSTTTAIITMHSAHVVYIFDVLTCPALMQQGGGLWRILQSVHVLKLWHDCRQDCANLWRQFGVRPNAVFDTQVAHSVLEFQQQEKTASGSGVYKAKTISLNGLCDFYGASAYRAHMPIKSLYRREPDFWMRRPLSRDHVRYSAGVVLTLIDERICGRMLSALHPHNYALMRQLCDEQMLMRIEPEVVRRRRRIRKQQAECEDLRTRLTAAHTTSTVVLTNREVRLLRHLDLTDSDRSKLKMSSCVKVARKLERLERAHDNSSSSDSCDNSCSEDYPSFDSSNQNNTSTSGGGGTSTQPTSLTESMQMVDSILSDTNLDRLDRINRLESALTSAVNVNNNSLTGASDEDSSSCQRLLSCEGERFISAFNNDNLNDIYNNNLDKNNIHDKNHFETCDKSTQTLSTGDIVVTKIHFDS